MEDYEDVNSLRNDLNSLKKLVERMALLLNKGFVKSLYEEAANIQNGDYLTEEEFFEKHKIKIH